MQETQVQSLGWEGPLEKEIAIHSSLLAWRIPWREETGGLQSIGSQRFNYNWVTLTLTSLFTFIDSNQYLTRGFMFAPPDVRAWPYPGLLWASYCLDHLGQWCVQLRLWIVTNVFSRSHGFLWWSGDPRKIWRKKTKWVSHHVLVKSRVTTEEDEVYAKPLGRMLWPDCVQTTECLYLWSPSGHSLFWNLYPFGPQQQDHSLGGSPGLYPNLSRVKVDILFCRSQVI